MTTMQSEARREKEQLVLLAQIGRQSNGFLHVEGGTWRRILEWMDGACSAIEAQTATAFTSAEVKGLSDECERLRKMWAEADNAKDAFREALHYALEGQ